MYNEKTEAKNTNRLLEQVAKELELSNRISALRLHIELYGVDGYAQTMARKIQEETGL